MRISDWSSDVCSSDLTARPLGIDRVLAQIFVGGLVIERDAPLPRAEIQEHRTVAVERGIYIPLLASHIEIGGHDVLDDLGFHKLEQHDLVAPRIPEKIGRAKV